MPRLEDFVNLSGAVYGNPPPTQVTVPSTEPGVNETWVFLLQSGDPSQPGYYGAAYFNARTKEVVLVNRGTNDLVDLVTDMQMALDKVPDQLEAAEVFYNDVKAAAVDREATLSITGHSLGGSLTQLLVASHAGDSFNGVPIFGQTFNAYGVKGLLDDLRLPDMDYRVTNWVVPSDRIGNLADHIGTKESLAGLPFSFTYLAGPPGVLAFFYDSHKIAQVQNTFIADNSHPLLFKTKEFLVKTYVTDPGFPVTIDGSVYVGGNNRQNVADQLIGGSANDLMFGGRPDDRIHGGDGQDVIYAGAGNDVLWGDGGADFLLGEDGDDTYHVDDSNDLVIESFDGGFDTVASTVSYTLARNVEQLILQGEDAINGTGNDLDNVIIGNNANNVLDGGAGKDSLAGGGGDDTYIVRDLNDRIQEGPGEGTDTVRSFVSYALGANLEKLILDGSFAVVGFGNSLDNELVGSEGDNVLFGGLGDDRLIGGVGDDVYLYTTGDGNDTIVDTASDLNGDGLPDGDGLGVVVFDHQMLVGGLKKQNESVYKNFDGQVTYEHSGSDLVVNGTLTIKDWQEGQFGIRLKDLPDDPQDQGGGGGRTEFLKIDHYVQVGNDPITGDPIFEPVYAPFFDHNAEPALIKCEQCCQP